jgi:hypothetical protein
MHVTAKKRKSDLFIVSLEGRVYILGGETELIYIKDRKQKTWFKNVLIHVKLIPTVFIVITNKYCFLYVLNSINIPY